MRAPGGGRVRRALIVRGGWEGHVPVEATELFRPRLDAAGFDVTVSDDLDVYLDRDLLAATDLVVQCWSMGTLTAGQCAGLVSAVHAGTGFAGWHGGVVATFGDSPDYLRMVGGLFLFHPPDFLRYRVTIAPEQGDHPIVAGLADFDVMSEQYWMLTDPLNTVLATTTITPEHGGHGGGPVQMPVVWTRRWGAGKVFFSAIGHRMADLCDPAVRTLTERGLLWASR
ncbi:ThuA domain-containing protein [Sphaerisporangium album]|uniref:ThuA domain-containing protein n=1 Tax=Sphaerisporangium album TaxID=509200 RepID=A0A367EZ72_9ACTN|nr:ThuA domain-containing protein [Sphaerisporangium album]